MPDRFGNHTWSEVENHLKAGGEVMTISNPTRVITPQHADLIKPEGRGFRIRTGKSSVYIFSNGLKLIPIGQSVLGRKIKRSILGG